MGHAICVRQALIYSDDCLLTLLLFFPLTWGEKPSGWALMLGAYKARAAHARPQPSPSPSPLRRIPSSPSTDHHRWGSTGHLNVVSRITEENYRCSKCSSCMTPAVLWYHMCTNVCTYINYAGLRTTGRKNLTNSGYVWIYFMHFGQLSTCNLSTK